MRFIETPIFTKQVQALLADEEYKSLQIALLLRPEQGAVMQGSGGLRKIRWAMKGSGKRGGLRVIYFWDSNAESFYMLYLYAKNKQEDLTADQLKILSRLVTEELA
uniref:type II toxin-antitoxin system RelE/ParE family toxin n=1 Tax=Candidatus Electronema sp. TaxID=2698783 RepID=UPI0040569E94